MRCRRQVQGVLALLVAALLSTAPTAAADPVSVAEVPMLPGPPQSGHGAAMIYARDHPGSAPPGTNDFGCRSAVHPRPVILLHGTDASAYADWAAVAPRLKAAGYCLFAIDYGGRPGNAKFGTEELAPSGQQVLDFLHRVLAATGADRADIVGYSQGATVGRYVIDRLGGAASVGRWVGVASPTYGGVMYGIVPIARTIPGALDLFAQVTSVAAVEQSEGSAFLNALNAGGDTVPGVEYTTIGSRYDEMIQPFENIALRSPGATNIVIQDVCPIDQTGHFNMVYDPLVAQLVLNALDPASAIDPPCAFVPLGTGIPEVIGAAHG